MRRHLFISVLLLVFVATCVLPAIAEDEQRSRPPAASTTQSTTDADAAKKKEQEDKDRKEKLRLEIKARREAEKRQWLEEHHRRYEERNSGGDVIIISSPGGGDEGGGGSTGTVYSSSYVRERERPKSTAGILFAPAQKGKTAGFGVQWLGPKKIGVTAWISGNMGYGDDVIDAAIPHDDYWLDDSKGSYALEGIVGLGSNDAMLIVGAGLAVTQTYHTAVSNVTGWQWKAGTDSVVQPAAHASLRFRLADRVNMQFGYDTTQYAFFGLSGSF